MTDSTKQATTFLTTSQGDLRTLLAKVNRLNNLNTAFANYLDDNLKNLCQVANLTGSQLIILAANGSAASQIRFQSSDLLNKFKTDPLLQSIQAIHCKVRPTTQHNAANSTANKIPPLSKETAQLIHDMAQGIENEKIREALERIATNVLD